MRRTRYLAATASVVLLGACTGAPIAPTLRASLAMGTAQVETRGAVALRVRLERSPAGRGLLATGGDVDRIEVRATSADASRTDTLAGTALVAGTATLTLANMVPGSYDLAIDVFDAAGGVIGRRQATSVVVAGRTTVLDLAVPLAPGLANPGVLLPSPPADDSFRSGVGAAFAFRPAPPVRYPAIEAQFEQGVPGIDATSVAPMADGSVWATTGMVRSDLAGSTPPTSWGKVVRILPSGTLEDHTPAHPLDAPNDAFKPFYVVAAPDGARVLAVPQYPALDSLPVATGVVFDAAGTSVSPSGMKVFGLAALDAGHKVWAVRENAGTTPTGKLTRYATTTTPTVVETFRTGFGARAIAADAAGNVWVRHTASISMDTNAYLSRYGPTGSRLAEFPDPVVMGNAASEKGAMACDMQGNLWLVVPETRELYKVSPAGAVLAEGRGALAFSNIAVDAAGGVWAYNRASLVDYPNEEHARQTPDHGMVTRFGADGALLGYYHIGADVHILDLAVTADGTMWLATASTGVLKVKVDVPFAP